MARSVLLVCGPPAVGKSTVAWEVFKQVAATGTRAAYIDLAQIGWCGTVPDDHALRARNLAALWASYRSAGARCLILSGRVNRPEDIRTYAAALPGVDLTVCRLRAGADALAERVRLRGGGGGPPLPGDELVGRPPDQLSRYAAHAASAAASLDRFGIGDLVLETDIHAPADLAAAIRARTGFPSAASLSGDLPGATPAR